MAVSTTFAAVGMIIVAVVAFVGGIFAAPIIFPSAAEDTLWSRISDAGKIKVGTEAGWPPYEYLDDEGNIIGFEIDLMEAIAEELDLEVEWQDMGFDAIIPAVQSKEIDLGVSGFSVTTERLDVVQFTHYHSITEGQIIMLQSVADSKGITEFPSLSNLTDYDLSCGAQVGTTQEQELNSVAPGALETYDDYGLAMDAMKIGAIDCVYAETPVTSNWILEAEQAGDPAIIVVFRRPYYPVAFVANKDASTLVAKINGALSDIIATGQLDVLREKWKS
jgi:ABC-type amino acid transport substrate-binding protein